MRKLDYKQLITKIQSWIQDLVKSVEADGIVVNLSGGIDSAVTTALCVNAIGGKNVIGLGLPCMSIPQDLNDAEMIANQLGIKLLVIDLSSVFEEFLKVSSHQIEGSKIGIANVKARLRMVTAYFIGQSKGMYLFGGTGNRTELAIGYFTKYGDGGVDFEPLGGLYKSEVRKIAKLLNIPNSIIKKPPSAGLWEGQTDEGELGITYDSLDEIIYRIDHYLDLNDLDKDDVKRVIEMIRLAEHKNNVPPIFKVVQT
ncbi:MAG: NAD+ synthase [Promethearchaeota archaeon]|jgi:NAD+ synthase